MATTLRPNSPRKRLNANVVRSQSVDLCPRKKASDVDNIHGGSKSEKLSVHSFYKIGRVIGDGNFAIVRECRHRKSNKKYALKIINKAKVKGKEHMIENEILILRRVRHDCIVRLVEEFETPKEISLVMELVAGGDLFDAIVEVTKFDERDSRHMVQDLASALLYLHTLNIIHRDIKPENLLVVHNHGRPPSLKLADFGLSIEVKSPLFLVCGTPTYVAPEILDESGYGLSVDMWALGVITYILLCGFPPFRSNDGIQQELFDKITKGDFEYLMPFWANVSDSAKDLIDNLLVVDRKKRYTAKDVLVHPWIQGVAEKQIADTCIISKDVEKNQTQRKRLRSIALAIQTVIALLALVRRRRKTAITFPLKETAGRIVARAESSTSTLSTTSGERSSSSLGNSDDLQKSLSERTMMKSKGSMYLSRIPRLQPSSASSHIAAIRRSIGKSNQEDNKSIFSPTSVKYYTGGRVTTASDACDDVVRRKISAPPPRRDSSSYSGVDQYDIIGAAFSRYHRLDENAATGQTTTARTARSYAAASSPSKVRLRVTARREGYRLSVPPGILENLDLSSDSQGSDSSPGESRCKSAVPMSPSKAKLRSYGSMQSLASPTRRQGQKDVVEGQPRSRSRNTKALPSSDSPILRAKKPIRNNDVQLRRYSMPVMPAAVSKGQKGQQGNNITLTTKTKRTENITIHSGKTVDKKIDTKTQTTLSLEFNDRKAHLPETIVESDHDGVNDVASAGAVGSALLTKVKRLAEEIETLATYDIESLADESHPRDDDVDLIESSPCDIGTESGLELDSLEDADDIDEAMAAMDRALTGSPGNDDCHQQSRYLSLPSRTGSDLVYDVAL